MVDFDSFRPNMFILFAISPNILRKGLSGVSDGLNCASRNEVGIGIFLKFL